MSREFARRDIHDDQSRLLPSRKNRIEDAAFKSEFCCWNRCTPLGSCLKSHPSYIGRITGGQSRPGSGSAGWIMPSTPDFMPLGNPDGDSPVFVSANYKMSFDELRRSLPGRNGWILVLDTDGINVWCAAGKGTFGTDELVRRIEATGLNRLVRHRKLILPQLAGPGFQPTRSNNVRDSPFNTVPIRAQDLPVYLDSGLKATPEMRRKTFTLKERAVLIPVELVEALKPTLSDPACPFSARRPGWSCGILGKRLERRALCGTGIFKRPLCRRRVESFASSLSSRKGVFHKRILHRHAHGFFCSLSAGFRLADLGRDAMEAVSWLLIIPAVAAYLAMNFTGCSTYTSLSGVKKEMRWALPLEIGMAGCGILAWVTSRIFL